jgi:hypothetical protein
MYLKNLGDYYLISNAICSNLEKIYPENSKANIDITESNPIDKNI